MVLYLAVVVAIAFSINTSYAVSTYIVEFDLNGGAGQGGYDYNKRKIKEQEIIAIGDPTKAEYKFIGWKLDGYDKNNSFIVGNNIHDYIKKWPL